MPPNYCCLPPIRPVPLLLNLQLILLNQPMTRLTLKLIWYRSSLICIEYNFGGGKRCKASSATGALSNTQHYFNFALGAAFPAAGRRLSGFMGKRTAQKNRALDLKYIIQSNNTCHASGAVSAATNAPRRVFIL